jgi:hypothetical protein
LTHRLFRQILGCIERLGVASDVIESPLLAASSDIVSNLDQASAR